jgi:hypothetical protein
MFEKTRYYRPWLGWLGVRVVRDDGEVQGVLGAQEGASVSLRFLLLGGGRLRYCRREQLASRASVCTERQGWQWRKRCGTR